MKKLKSLLQERQQLNEDIILKVNVGDTILMGKFLNKKVKVKSIGKDEHGMPTINGKSVTRFRIVKSDIKESPDGVDNHKYYNLDYSQNDAYAFGYAKGKMFVSNGGGTHDSIYINYSQKDSESKNYDIVKDYDRDNLKYPGRIWLKSNLISFWIYPKPNKLLKVLNDLKKEMQRINNINININKLKIELPRDYRNKEAVVININQYINISKIDKRNDDELNQQHMISPIAKNKKVPKGTGSRKYPAGLTYSQYKQLMSTSENKKMNLKSNKKIELIDEVKLTMDELEYINDLLYIMKKTKAGTRYKQAVKELIKYAKLKTKRTIRTVKDALVALDIEEPYLESIQLRNLIRNEIKDILNEKILTPPNFKSSKDALQWYSGLGPSTKVSDDVIDPETGEIYLQRGQSKKSEKKRDIIKKIKKANVGDKYDLYTFRDKRDFEKIFNVVKWDPSKETSDEELDDLHSKGYDLEVNIPKLIARKDRKDFTDNDEWNIESYISELNYRLTKYYGIKLLLKKYKSNIYSIEMTMI